MNNLNNFLSDNSCIKELRGIESISGLAVLFENQSWLKNNSCLLVATPPEIEKIKKFLEFKKPWFCWSELPSFPLTSHLFSKKWGLERRGWQANASTKKPFLFLASPQALLKKTSLKTPLVCLKEGDQLPDLQKLLYESKNLVQKVGDFSSRGFLCDIYTPTQDSACRLEVLDNEIVSIHLLSKDFKKREASLDEIVIPSLIEWTALGEDRKNLCALVASSAVNNFPLKDELLRKISRGDDLFEMQAIANALDQTCSLDFFPSKNPVLLFKPEDIKSFFKKEVEKSESIHPLFIKKNLYLPYEKLLEVNPIIISDKAQQPFSQTSTNDSHTVNLCQLLKKTKDIKKFLEELPVSHIVLAFQKPEAEDQIKKIIFGNVISDKNKNSGQCFLQNKTLIFLKGQLKENFFNEGETAYLQIESWLPQTTKSPESSTFEFFKERSKALEFSELEKGSLVVHRQHGLAKFEELKTLDLEGRHQDFFVLIYQKGDRLLIPAYKAKDIKKYSKKREAQSIEKFLDRLGDPRRWDNKKTQAKKHIQSIVIDLINHYRKRKQSYRKPFKKHEKAMAVFAEQFPFTETVSQTKVIEEVFVDMDQDHPMDRLICADVGFGKTEVSLRASLRALENNFQVCFLVPTTVLSLQHYENFKIRFKDWPYNIDILNRFISAKKRKEVLDKVQQGQIDFLIATHSVFSPQLSFKNLGLLVIDEEHRFGVKQKEKLLRMKSHLDSLSLSATPIPRTLHMALSGMKDISVLSKAPEKRKSVKTFIKSWDENIEPLIVEACKFEKKREGQTLFIHNRIKTILQRMEQLQSLLPNFKIACIHGGMPSSQIEKSILGFFERKYDILVSTNIVESGMDIPHANTIFIDRVQEMGLNQIYQLRGRVGRREQQAYCYLLIPNRERLSSVASERLSLLEKHSEIGSGFRLAMHDLEMRGSGSLFGAEQSGHLHALGEELFFEILNESLEDEKQDAFVDPEISIPLSIGIPSSYIHDPKMRLLYYKNLSEAKKPDQLQELKEEILENFGEFPEELHNLFSLLKIKSLCKKRLITDLKVLKNSCRLTFHEKTPVSSDKILELIDEQGWKMLTEHCLKIPLKENKDLCLEVERILFQI